MLLMLRLFFSWCNKEDISCEKNNTLFCVRFSTQNDHRYTLLKKTQGFEIMNLRFAFKIITHCATLLGYNMGKKKMIIFVYFDRKYLTKWRLNIIILKKNMSSIWGFLWNMPYTVIHYFSYKMMKNTIKTLIQGLCTLFLCWCIKIYKWKSVL